MAGIDRKKVIIFHHETDKKYLERLRVHLTPLEKKYLIEVWDTTSILPGAVRHAETQQALSTAKVAILLINADFLASDFVENELPMLLDINRAKGTVILSIITNYCAFQGTKLSQFQAVNTSSTPLSSMNKSKQEKLWNEVSGYVKNATLSPTTEEDVDGAMNESKQDSEVNRLFPSFFYRDDTTIDNLLSQLEVELTATSNGMSKFVRLYATLTRKNMLRQFPKFSQAIYDDIQLGQILEMRGKAKLSQWEETANAITDVAGLGELMKVVTGQDPWKNADERQAYQGMTSLVAMHKPEKTIVVVRPLDAPRFQFIARLEPQYINCKKTDLKTELTFLGMVQRRLAPGETIDVFRLIPDMSSLENMNRSSRRKAEKAFSQNSPVDEIIKYPAVNIYPIAIY